MSAYTGQARIQRALEKMHLLQIVSSRSMSFLDAFVCSCRAVILRGLPSFTELFLASAQNPWPKNQLKFAAASFCSGDMSLI
jgi:hypothetical protein